MSENVVKLRNHVAIPAGSVGRLLAVVRDWNTRRAAKAELRSMPDYLLHDIGIRRELIDEYVDGLVGRRAARVVGMDRTAPAPARDEAKAA